MSVNNKFITPDPPPLQKLGPSTPLIVFKYVIKLKVPIAKCKNYRILIKSDIEKF